MALANIGAVVTALQDPARFPDGTSIYVADVYDPSDGTGHVNGCFFDLTLPELITALDVWRDRYIELGTQMGFGIVDMLGHFHGHGYEYATATNPYYDTDDPTLWFADCVHPNDIGHDQIRQLFFEAIDGSYWVE